MTHRRGLASFSKVLGITSLLLVTPWAAADDNLVELKLKPKDIAAVTMGDPLTIELQADIADGMRATAAANPGKTLRILFRSVIVKDAVLTAEPPAGNAITVASPSEALKEAMQCWEKGCPDADGDDGCD